MKTVRNVVASAILAALVFVLLRFVAIPTPFPDTTLSIYAAVVAFFAVLFGPVVGFVGGFLGNLLVDLTAGWGVWWTWVVVTGLYGLFVGLGCKGIDLEDGVFETTGISEFNAEENGEGIMANRSGIYDLQGRRVDASMLKQGVYIQNGRKVMKK